MSQGALRQAMEAVPDSLIEAARIDGMREFDTFWYVARPIVWPALVSLGVFTFVFSWNNFFWPLIVVDSERSKTLPLAIADLSAGQYVDSWPVQMAAGTILIVPLIVVFLFHPLLGLIALAEAIVFGTMAQYGFFAPAAALPSPKAKLFGLF